MSEFTFTLPSFLKHMVSVSVTPLIFMGILNLAYSVKQASPSCPYDYMHKSGQPIAPVPYAPQTVATVTINNQPAFNIDGAHLASNPCSAIGAMKQLRGLSNDDHIKCINSSCPELNIGNPN